MWGGIRSPESATQCLNTEGMSGNLAINVLTAVSVSGTRPNKRLGPDKTTKLY